MAHTHTTYGEFIIIIIIIIISLGMFTMTWYQGLHSS